LILCLLVLLEGPIYHPETIDSIQTSRHTHVVLVGHVAFVKREADGDVHLRLVDAHGHRVVIEIIPELPLVVPRRGQVVRVWGIRRFDNEAGHGWWEVHPARKLEVLR
jgi:hypothetical protein